MSTKNVTLHDENGNVLLPATKTSRVTDTNGTNLDTLLEDVSYFGDTVGNVIVADFNAQTDTVWNKTQVLGSTQQATARNNINAQETLVSGTNIKTINNESILGSGNITISGGGGEANVIESISINGTAQTVTSKNVDLAVPTSSTITAIVTLTEAQYTALATKDNGTLYLIPES